MNEVANVKAGAVAPAFIDDEDFGTGFEGADASSYAIPFLQILQKMSPMVDEDDPKHIEGAKAGMIYNTVTQKMVDGKTGLVIIPCHFKRSYILWGGRESGDSGFKGEISAEEFDKIPADKLEIVDGRPLVKAEDGTTHPKKSDYYADTRSHYVICIDPENGEIGQAIISLSSTQIKASKILMTALSQKKTVKEGVTKSVPPWANLVRFTTVSQSNDKGSWSGAHFALEGFVESESLYALAKEFRKAVMAGEIKVDHSKNPMQTGDVADEPKSADNF